MLEIKQDIHKWFLSIVVCRSEIFICLNKQSQHSGVFVKQRLYSFLIMSGLFLPRQIQAEQPETRRNENKTTFDALKGKAELSMLCYDRRLNL